MPKLTLRYRCHEARQSESGDPGRIMAHAASLYAVRNSPDAEDFYGDAPLSNLFIGALENPLFVAGKEYLVEISEITGPTPGQ